MIKPAIEDIMRCAAGLGTLEIGLSDSAMFIPYPIQPHTREVEMHLLRALLALTEVAAEAGYTINAECVRSQEVEA